MIKVFYGDDRVRAQQEIVRWLGTRDYEVIEGSEVDGGGLLSIFRGGSLFDSGERKIVVRDLMANSAVAGLLAERAEEYVATPNRVALFETKLDKRSAAYKALKDKVEMREFAARPSVDMRKVFEIYRVAKYDGSRAVAMLREIEATEEPKRFVGLVASQVMKEFGSVSGLAAERSEKILQELAKTDMMLSKTTQPWLAIESFLVRLGNM